MTLPIAMKTVFIFPSLPLSSSATLILSPILIPCWVKKLKVEYEKKPLHMFIFKDVWFSSASDTYVNILIFFNGQLSRLSISLHAEENIILINKLSRQAISKVMSP